MSSSDVDRVTPPLIWGGVTVAFASVFVALRFISRGYLLRVLGPPDWIIAFSLALSLGYTGVTIVGLRSGVGQHVWDVPPQQLRVFFQSLYAGILLYSVAVAATKSSILLLLLSVFSSMALRRTAYVVFAAVLAHSIWLIFSNAFFCTPARAFWDLDVPRDRCFDTVKWFYEMWVHIILDFLIFLLPIPVIRSMTLPWRQKFWLYFVFALGFVVCLIASIRLYFMYHGVTSPDPTYDGMLIHILAFVELNLSIAIPCIITIKPLVDKLFPCLLVRKRAESRMNSDGSPARQSDSEHPPTISSAPTRRVTQDPGDVV